MNKNDAIIYKKYEILSCRVCGSKKLENVLSLGNQYLSDFTTKNILPKKFPLELVLCNKCFLLQLRHTTPSKYLYTERYGYRSGINNTMRFELKEIVSMSKKRVPVKKNDIVIDIGSNDGTLLGNYSTNIVRVGFEPVTKFAIASKKQADYIINDYFSYKSFLANTPKKIHDKKAKIVTAISMFYDIDDPNSFVSDVSKLLAEDGVFIIQQNYVGGMLRQNAFDNILHEHLEYYSLKSLQELLARHNMYVFDVEETPINGGSFRTYIKFMSTDNSVVSKAVLEMQKKEKLLKLDKKDTYKKFGNRVEEIREKIYRFVKKETDKGKTIYVYGASTRGNTLLQYCKLNNVLVKAAVERNTEKWGKKIASIGVPIISEEQARKEKPDYMLVLPWFFREEFLFREKKYLENGGHFIFPLPKVEVV